MRSRILSYSAFFTLLLAPSVYAHHNSAGHYLMRELISMEGVVTKFEMINPHVRVYFDVKSAKGETEAWVAEGNSISFVKRAGWKDGELKKGDHIKVTGRPSRDGSKWVLWSFIIKPDGTKLLGGNSIDTFDEAGNSDERKRALKAIRDRQIQQRDQQQKPPSEGTEQPK